MNTLKSSQERARVKRERELYMWQLMSAEADAQRVGTQKRVKLR